VSGSYSFLLPICYSDLAFVIWQSVIYQFYLALICVTVSPCFFFFPCFPILSASEKNGLFFHPFFFFSLGLSTATLADLWDFVYLLSKRAICMHAPPISTSVAVGCHRACFTRLHGTRKRHAPPPFASSDATRLLVGLPEVCNCFLHNWCLILSHGDRRIELQLLMRGPP
jgi:hypothetical protein